VEQVLPEDYDRRYAAPEVLHSKQKSQQVTTDPSQDIWALGMLAYEVLTGDRVFPDGDNGTILKHANALSPYPWSRPKLHPAFEKSPTRELIEGCTRRDPKSRLDAQKIVQQLHRMGNMQTIKDPTECEQH
jgi:serine/threonine protein kinase